MSKYLIVVATQDELPLIDKVFPKRMQYANLTPYPVLITGVGALNIMNALSNIPRDTTIINIGYAGSNCCDIGDVVSIGRSCLFHPSVDYKEPENLLPGVYTCYTSTDFVTKTTIKKPAIFDMELAFIVGLGFDTIYSYKIVSDNLNLKEYEKTIQQEQKGD